MADSKETFLVRAQAQYIKKAPTGIYDLTLNSNRSDKILVSFSERKKQNNRTMYVNVA